MDAMRKINDKLNNLTLNNLTQFLAKTSKRWGTAVRYDDTGRSWRCRAPSPRATPSSERHSSGTCNFRIKIELFKNDVFDDRTLGPSRHKLQGVDIGVKRQTHYQLSMSLERRMATSAQEARGDLALKGNTTHHPKNTP